MSRLEPELVCIRRHIAHQFAEDQNAGVNARSCVITQHIERKLRSLYASDMAKRGCSNALRFPDFVSSGTANRGPIGD